MTVRKQIDNQEPNSTPRRKNNKAKSLFYSISGISDFQLIFRNVNDTKNLLKERVSFIKAQTEIIKAQGKSLSGTKEKSFQEVMANSEFSEEKLINKATKYKRYWLIAMVISAIGVLFTGAGLVRLIVDSGFTWGICKPFLTLLLLTAVGMLAFVKSITYEFLGWRLVNRCNSEEEEGTYPYFVGDYGLYQAFKFDKAGHIRGSYEKA